MAFLGVVVTLAVAFIPLSHPQPFDSRATPSVSNAESSLTLLYQNNLNGSDDKNHIGAILLDPVPRSRSAGACAALDGLQD